MKKAASRALFRTRKAKGTRRAERPPVAHVHGPTAFARHKRCSANRASLADAGCMVAFSTGVRTKAGKERNQRRARTQMLERWQRYRAENGGKVPLSEAGREKIRQAARRTMRLRHRKREALEWADSLMEKNEDWNICLWDDRRHQILLAPFKTALDCGGMEELCELAGLVGLDLKALPSGTEPTGVILGKYAPGFNLRELAADFRRGAGS